MPFFIEETDEKRALEILHWKYKFPYDFYNNEMTDESLAEMLDGSYQMVIDGKQDLFGFFCTEKSAQVPAGRKIGAYPENFTDIGLGMDPVRTGKGSGAEFFACILQYIEESHTGIPLRLTVARFNKRAIHLYAKFGFVKEKEFKTDFAEFITMIKEQS